jgi:flagella basal body P-ring formation protein FlgA
MNFFQTFCPRHRRPLVAKFFICFLLAGPGGGLPVFTVHAENAPAAAPAAHVLNEADLLKLLTSTLQHDYVKDRGELELVLTQPWPAPTVPDEPLKLKILEMPTAGVTSSFIIRFQLCTATRSIGTWQTSVQAHIWRDVWVAHSDISRGDLPADADVAIERRDVLPIRESLAGFSADDTSLEFAESVRAGQPLLARMLRPRAVIHRGQIADAVVQDGGLSVTTKVEALEDGAPGQFIHARNSVSRRDLTGRVLDGRTILISL